MTTEEALKWVWENKTITLVTLWPILSGLFNLLTHYKSVEDWVKFAENHPRSAHLIKLMRGAGLDPIKVAKAFIGFIFGKAHQASLEGPENKKDKKPDEVAPPSEKSTDEKAEK